MPSNQNQSKTLGNKLLLASTWSLENKEVRILNTNLVPWICLVASSRECLHAFEELFFLYFFYLMGYLHIYEDKYLLPSFCFPILGGKMIFFFFSASNSTYLCLSRINILVNNGKPSLKQARDLDGKSSAEWLHSSEPTSRSVWFPRGKARPPFPPGACRRSAQQLWICPDSLSWKQGGNRERSDDDMQLRLKRNMFYFIKRNMKK